MDKFKILLLYISISIGMLYSKDSVYTGNWPQNPNANQLKIQSIDEIKCPKGLGCSCSSNDDCSEGSCLNFPKGGSYCVPSKGAQLPNFSLVDQFEEVVNIYDFAGHGKYILIELSTAWCDPCHKIAQWLTFNDSTIYSQRWFKKEYDKIRNMIQNDEVYLINIHFEDEWKDNVSIYSVADWYSLYPDEHVPILADTDKAVHTLMKPTGLPAVILLNENLEVMMYSNRGVNQAFDELLKLSQ